MSEQSAVESISTEGGSSPKLAFIGFMLLLLPAALWIVGALASYVPAIGERFTAFFNRISESQEALLVYTIIFVLVGVPLVSGLLALFDRQPGRGLRIAVMTLGFLPAAIWGLAMLINMLAGGGSLL